MQQIFLRNRLTNTVERSLPSSEMLHSARWFDTGVSGLPIGPSSRTLKFLVLEDATEASVSKHLTLRKNPEDGRLNFNLCGSVRSNTAQWFILLCPQRFPLRQYSQWIWCQPSHIPTPGPKNQSPHSTDDVVGVGFLLLTGDSGLPTAYVMYPMSLYFTKNCNIPFLRITIIASLKVLQIRCFWLEFPDMLCRVLGVILTYVLKSHSKFWSTQTTRRNNQQGFENMTPNNRTSGSFCHTHASEIWADFPVTVSCMKHDLTAVNSEVKQWLFFRTEIRVSYAQCVVSYSKRKKRS
jgi:hypothetical protein